MPWPSVRKHVFAYILNRLQLFTQVDADTLQVSGSSVCVENVEIDVTRLPAIPGVSITLATLGSVSVTLSTQGVLVEVSGLTASAVVDQLEPDLALSTILEHTRNDIETEFASDLDDNKQEVGYGIGDVSGIVSRLADIALAQLSVKLSDSTLYLELGDVTYEVNTGHIAFGADKTVDVNDVSVCCVQPNEGDYEHSQSPRQERSGLSGDEYDDDDDEDEDDDDDEGEDPMSKSIMVGSRSVRFAPDLAQSVYFDTMETSQSSLESSIDMAKQIEGTVATIDHLTLHYSFEPAEVVLGIDNIHVQLIPALYALVQVLNYALEGQAANKGSTALADSGSSNGSKPKESISVTCSIAKVNIEDDGAVSSISDISLASSTVSVGTLVVPGVLTAPTAPVFSGTMADGCLSAKVEGPISFEIPKELTGYAAKLSRKIFQALKHLQAPPNSSPTPLSVRLPELRLAAGDITAIIFPESLTHTGLSLSEVTVVARDSQVLVKNVDITFAIQSESLPTIRVGDIHTLVTRGAQDALRSLIDEISPEFTCTSALSLDGNASMSAPAGLVLPEIEVVHILADVSDYNGLVVEAREIRASGHTGSARDIEISNGKNKCSCSAKMDLLNSTTCVLAIKDVEGDLWPFVKGNKAGSGASAEAGTVKATESYQVMPSFALKLSAKGNVLIHSEDYALRAVGKLTVDVIGGAIVVAVPKVTLNIVDGQNEISLCEVHEAEATIRRGENPMEANLNISRLVWECCPDSYQVAIEILEASLPKSVMPAFSIDSNGSVDILEDVDFGETTRSSELDTKVVGSESAAPLLEDSDNGLEHIRTLSIEEPPSISLSEEIDVNEAYLESATLPREMSVWQKGIISVMRVRVTRMTWRLYDGFDLATTRKSIASAIESLESAAEAKRKSANDRQEVPDETVDNGDEDSDSDSDTDDVVLGNVLYNSVFIGKALVSTDDLRTSVEETVGSSSLERSAAPKLVVKAAGLSVHTHHFAVSEGVYSRTEVKLADLLVEDKLESSVFDHLFERQNRQGRLLSMDIELVDPDAPEQRLYINVLPLRIKVDQDTLEFLTRFFTFDLHAGDDPIDSGETSNGNDPISGEFNDKGSTRTPPSTSKDSMSTFIQRAEIMDINLLIDYNPKKFDYAGLRSGYTAELMNIFVLQEAKLTLRHVVLHGLSGMDRFGDELLQIWGPEIRANQLGGILVALGPIRSMVRLANGKAGAIGKSTAVSSVRRGATVLVKRTASGFLKLLDS